MKIGLQMYTIRDAITNGDELLAALTKVKSLGYEGVEFAGYHNLPAPELAQHLSEIGLAVAGSHESIDAMENDMDTLIEYAKAIGNRNISMAWSETDTEEKLARTLNVLRSARAKAEPHGIRVLYHNHDHEFKPLGDRLPIDEIMQVCPLEADCYWIFYAGGNAPAYLRKNASSIGLVHIKDGGSQKPSPCALGEGENDIAGICAAAAEIGTEWLIVEDDFPTPNGFADIERSMKWLQQHI
ncbi:MAG: sugar phosphate isomerase/epimerase family protein [Angelakisella sp.]